MERSFPPTNFKVGNVPEAEIEKCLPYSSEISESYIALGNHSE